eukprot:CAMPEP_0171116938 /NCGR_PEP_ID=MMETSP0766_2-20121228/91407_1 /TAXON_ID=439317 /ORGANISM="Gambierdiscus australes, Strain CAWD 149" /LENGTH=37 /DNA_ID= /DNA_START= /DNA_END= /DNA_ORIENTATION=
MAKVAAAQGAISALSPTTCRTCGASPTCTAQGFAGSS